MEDALSVEAARLQKKRKQAEKIDLEALQQHGYKSGPSVLYVPAPQQAEQSWEWYGRSRGLSQESNVYSDCITCCSRGSGENATAAGRDDSEAETAEVAMHKHRVLCTTAAELSLYSSIPPMSPFCTQSQCMTQEREQTRAAATTGAEAAAALSQKAMQQVGLSQHANRHLSWH